jgi:putative colanic acid biosynthesis UDP-glucose lipid carrier transferase
MLFLGMLWFGNLPANYDVEYYQMVAILNVLWFIVSWVKNLYRIKYISSFEIFSRETLRAYAHFVVLSVLYLYFDRRIKISRLFMGVEFVAIAAGFMFNRVINFFFQFILGKNHVARRILIIGYNQTSKKLAHYLEEEHANTQIVGYCEEEENVQELSNYPIVSRVSNVMNFCKLYGHITEIYSTISPEQNHYIYQLMQEADQECIRFKIIPDFNFYVKLPTYINHYNDIPVLSVRKEPLDDMANRIKKRIFDLFVSSGIILFILSWMIPLVGLLIWIEDRGPVFFMQKRTGKDNNIFDCIKFRSMRMNADADSKQATSDDERITHVGKILRRTSLDEFPQFLNVFMGHMSLVGPRPHMVKHTNEFSKMINQYMIRQFVKPGVTGWAQINGYRGEIRKLDDLRKRVQYDLWYLENWGLWFDMKIIFLTIYNILCGDENAY